MWKVPGSCLMHKLFCFEDVNRAKHSIFHPISFGRGWPLCLSSARMEMHHVQCNSIKEHDGSY